MNKLELFLTVCTIAGAVWTYIKGKDKERAMLAANVALLGVCATILLSVRFEIIPDIQERQELSENLLDDERTLNLVRRMSAASTAADASPDALMREYSKRYYKSYLSHLEDLAHQAYTVDGAELLAFSQRYIAAAQKEIIATSYVRVNGWWRGEQGRQYHEVNRRLIADQHVRITRFFIVDDEDELHEIRDLVAMQQDIGVQVYVIIKAKHPSYRHAEDLILIDGVKAGRLVLSSDREPISARMTTNPDDVESVRAAIERLKPMAIEGARLMSPDKE